MNRVNEPLVRSKMAITLELMLCLLNFSQGNRKITRGTMGTDLTRTLGASRQQEWELISTAAQYWQICKVKTLFQNLGKHLYFPGEHFLIIMMGVQYKRFLPGAVQQLKLLPRVNTSHFLRPTVDILPYFNGPKANKQNKLGLERT